MFLVECFHSALQALIDTFSTDLIGFLFATFKADEWDNIFLRGKCLKIIIIDQQSIGEYDKYYVWIVFGDLEEGWTHEWFTTSNHDEGDTKTMCLIDDGPKLLIGKFLFDCRSDSFFVASFTVEVTLVGDTEDHYWRDMCTLELPFLTSFSCFFLPAVGFDEVKCLGGVGEADFDGVFEKDFKCIVEEETEISVFLSFYGESPVCGLCGGDILSGVLNVSTREYIGGME
jgi:hypothetical protein